MIYATAGALEQAIDQNMKQLVQNLNDQKISAVNTAVDAYTTELDRLRSSSSPTSGQMQDLRNKLDAAIISVQTNGDSAKFSSYPYLLFPTQVHCYTVYFSLLYGTTLEMQKPLDTLIQVC